MNPYDWALEAHPEPVPTNSRQRRDGTAAGGDPRPDRDVAAGIPRPPSPVSDGEPAGDPGNFFAPEVAGHPFPREPARLSVPGRAVGQNVTPGRRHLRLGSPPPGGPVSRTLKLARPVAALAVAAAAAIGTIRLIEWSGTAGTWWALAVVYAVAAGAGVLIAVLARPMILGDHIDDNELT